MKKDHRGSPRFGASGDGAWNVASPKGWWLHLAGVRSVGTSDAVQFSESAASKHAARDWASDHASSSRVRIGLRLRDAGMIKGVECFRRIRIQKISPAPGPTGRVPANWESLLN